MLNPNKADRDRSDETVDRCKDLAAKWRYSTVWVCNLFPVRAGNSNDLPRDRMGPHGPEGSRFNGCELCRGHTPEGVHINDRHILEASLRASIIVCAWGGKGGLSERGREITRMLVRAGHEGRLYTFGLTKTERQPRHAKPQLREQWPKPADLKLWSGVEAWLAENRRR